MQKHKEDPEPIRLKFLPVGDLRVGKSSFIKLISEGMFSQQQKGIGCEFAVKKMIVNQIPVKVYIWDTHGSERYHSLTRSAFRNLDVALFMYSVTDIISLKSIDQRWIRNKRDSTLDDAINGGLEFLVGNKADLELQREVPLQMIQDVSLRQSIQWRQISMKNGEGVRELFKAMVIRVLKRKGILKENQQVILEQQNQQCKFIKPENKRKCI